MSSTGATVVCSSTRDIFLLLQLTIELASDSKDFSAALAKMQLAEMGNVKTVPVVQQPKLKSQPVVTSKPENNAG